MSELSSTSKSSLSAALSTLRPFFDRFPLELLSLRLGAGLGSLDIIPVKSSASDPTGLGVCFLFFSTLGGDSTLLTLTSGLLELSAVIPHC